MDIVYKKQWDFLKNKSESGQLAHAYLLIGQEGIGKKFFAKEFAELIGCKFPDLMTVESPEISIAKIREIQKFLAYKSYHGGNKVVIVDNAHLMKQEAQSCFLKTLEEPKGRTILFLITSKPDLILPTIASRCQTIKFFRPSSLPYNKEKEQKENQIFQDISKVLDADVAEKFTYVKSIDFEKQSPMEILLALQKYFRKKLLNDFSDKKSKEFLELSEEISQKLLLTNANPKLALEIMLMEI